MGRPQSPKIFKMEEEISTLEAKVGAYTIEDEETGKQYHGSTINLYRRVIEHQNDLRSNKHGNCNVQELFNSGKKLTLKFFPTSTSEEAIRKEQELIDNTNKDLLLNRSYDAKNFVVGNWKNPELREQLSKSRLGNKNALGTKHTDEFKKNAAERLKGNKHLLGHTHTEETRKKMSEKRLGVKHTPEHIAASAEARTKERAVIDGVVYQNAAAAGKALGLNHKSVKYRCKSDKYPNFKLVPK